MADLVNAADGTVLASYEYKPFGETIRSTGPLAKNNPLRFSTKYQDDESDLDYYGHRFYKASTGSWLSRDPIGEREGKNLYGFVSNDPEYACDKLGLKPSYTYTEESAPSGGWLINIADINFPDGAGGKRSGFKSHFYTMTGNNACQCHLNKFTVVQAVRNSGVNGVVRPVRMDTSDYDQYNKKITPIPDYWNKHTLPFKPQLGSTFGLVDSPVTYIIHNQEPEDTWEFDDCAVCRTKDATGNVPDRLQGCVRFKFSRDSSGEAFLTPGGQTLKISSALPAELWRKALKNWAQLTGENFGSYAQ